MTNDMGTRTEAWRQSNPFIKCRTANGMSHQQAADAVGVDAATFMQWEFGAQEPTARECSTISTAAGVTQDDWKRGLLTKPHVQVLPPR